MKIDWKNMKIDLYVFYIWGMICFAMIGLGNLYMLIHNWGVSDLGAKLSTGFGVVFDVGLILFFNHFYQALPKKGSTDDFPTEEDLDKFLQEKNLTPKQ